jgi:HEAT repeat protein
LFARIEDPDGRVVQAAVSAIQSLGGAETEKRALELARSAGATVRRSALRILAYFGYPSAFEVMVAAANDPDQRIRDAGMNGLAFIEDDRATEALLRISKDPSARTRSSTMKALGHRSADAAIVATLTAGLADGDPWVRYYACQSLGKLGVREMAPNVEKLLRDPAGQVRVAAVETLALLGGEPARRALLTAASRPDDEDMRRAALVGLGMTRDREALDALSAAAAAADPMTRLIAVSALAAFDASEVVPSLAKASEDPEESVRTAALGCLAVRPGVEATAALIHMLEVTNAPERVVLALSSPVEGRIPGLVSALHGADERLATQLVSVLGRMGTLEATTALIELMATHPPVVRKAAATTLGALGTTEAVATLRRAAKDDTDLDIRRIAALLGPS